MDDHAQVLEGQRGALRPDVSPRHRCYKDAELHCGSAVVSTRWLSDSAWSSCEPAEVPTKPGHTRRDWPAMTGTRRRGQEKGAFTCPASKSARCPHPSVSLGTRLPGRGLVAQRTHPDPRQHSPDRKWFEALD